MSKILEGIGVILACWLFMLLVAKGFVLWIARRERS
jgi:hypothetical protein